MEVIPGAGTPRAEHDGRTYHFCCGHCRERFLAEPTAYAHAAT
jgi:Cu+-exporting ATPase